MDEGALSNFQARLDEFHRWPRSFTFKFIAPREKTADLLSIFEGKPFTTRQSKSGRYVSLTAEWEISSSDEVIAIYRQVARIQGVLAL